MTAAARLASTATEQLPPATIGALVADRAHPGQIPVVCVPDRLARRVPSNHACQRRSASSSRSGRSSFRVSPSIAALDLSALSSRSLRTAGSVSSRSILRRDVVVPVTPSDEVAGGEAAERALVLRAPSSPSVPPPLAAPNFVLANVDASLDPLRPLDAHHQYLPSTNARGMEPKEVIRDRSRVPGDGNDPPGEAADAGPFTSLDLVPFVPGHSGGGGGGGGGVRWVDTRNASKERVDRAIMRRYDLLASAANAGDCAPGAELRISIDPPSSDDLDRPPAPPPSPTSLLLRNPRIRIATVSSGYKKANYFVREDLDTRIYFHQVEDAVSYMGKRGYVKMEKEEEEEWRELLRRAHRVVKVSLDLLQVDGGLWGKYARWRGTSWTDWMRWEWYWRLDGQALICSAIQSRTCLKRLSGISLAVVPARLQDQTAVRKNLKRQEELHASPLELAQK